MEVATTKCVGWDWRFLAVLLHQPPLALILSAGRVQSALFLTAQWRGGAHFFREFRGASHKTIWFAVSGDNSPIFSDGIWSERWEKVLLYPWASCMAREMVYHITAGQEGPLCSGSTSQEHQCSAHPCDPFLWSSHHQGTALDKSPQVPLQVVACGEPPAWVCPGMGSPCHQGGQQDIAGQLGVHIPA